MAVKSNNSVAPMFNVLEDIINSIRTAAGSVVEAKAVGKATLKIDNGNPGKSFITFDAIDGAGNSLGVPQVLYDKNQTIQNRLDDITKVQEHIANQKAIIGARTNSLDRQKELIAQRSIAVQKDMSKISDADLAALVTELQGQITGLQASQQAFVKISNLSLFQFLN